MATKLYVGNLPFQTTSDELKDHFAQAGSVESASVVEDRMTGRSRGFGFVEMATPEEAAAAIEQLNGKDFGGRNLTVNEARPRTDRGPGGGGGYGGGGNRGGGGYGGGGGGGGYGGGGRPTRQGSRSTSQSQRPRAALVVSASYSRSVGFFKPGKKGKVEWRLSVDFDLCLFVLECARLWRALTAIPCGARRRRAYLTSSPQA